MSWMDWGAKPKKSAATPPPYYLMQGGDKTPYCHSCGRVIGSRRSQSAKAATTEVKFCSDRCKRHKLRPVDRRIEAAFAALLDGQDASHLASVPGGQEGAEVSTSPQDKPPAKPTDSNKKKKLVKGDPRLLIPCSEVEELVFGIRTDPEKTFGRRKNRARRGVPDEDTWKSVDMEGSDTDPGSVDSIVAEAAEDSADGGVELPDTIAQRIRPAQSQSEVNGSIGGEKGWAERIDETPEMLQKRRDGQRRAEEREMVRCAARRAVVFGLERLVEAEKQKKPGKNSGEEKPVATKRLCEAVMNGAVVEPSFAKGDWSIRWRED